MQRKATDMLRAPHAIADANWPLPGLQADDEDKWHNASALMACSLLPVDGVPSVHYEHAIRPHFNADDNKLLLCTSGRFDLQAPHEIMHWIEAHNLNFNLAGIIYRNARCPTVLCCDINQLFDATPWTKDKLIGIGGFVEPYTGRFYEMETLASEIHSTTLEALIRNAVDLAIQDPHLFDYCIEAFHDVGGRYTHPDRR